MSVLKAETIWTTLCFSWSILKTLLGVLAFCIGSKLSLLLIPSTCFSWTKKRYELRISRSKQPPYCDSSFGFHLPFICPSSSEFNFNKPEECLTVGHSWGHLPRHFPPCWLDAGKRTLPQGFRRVRLSPPENTRAHNFEAAHETVSLCPNKPEQSVTARSYCQGLSSFKIFTYYK